MQPEVVICQAGDPAMTGCIQLGCGQYICERIIICIYIEGQPIQVFVEFLDHCPLEGEKLQLVCWVMGFSLVQASTGIGYNCFSAILSCLVEDSSQTSATGISMKLEWLRKIGICKNRCCGTECFQVIKGLLTPAVPPNGSLLLARILT